MGALPARDGAALSRVTDFAQQCVSTLFDSHGEDMPNEPSRDEMVALRHVLCHRPTTTEENEFTSAWDAAYLVKVGG